ncbi:MAG: prenyltransferase/squalene oxidase repeat-containing protein [Candidatus Brocadiia bacterium]
MVDAIPGSPFRAVRAVAGKDSATASMNPSAGIGPWAVASVLTHAIAILILSLLCLGGPQADQGIDMTTTLSNKEPTAVEPETPSLPADTGIDDDSMDETETQWIPEGEAVGDAFSSDLPAFPVIRDQNVREFRNSARAVDLGLQWLAQHQESDGHWDTRKWGGYGDYDPGVCGLALLAFAGYGHTERSGKYMRVVRKAIDWLASQQDDKGNFAPHTTMYSHAIPTLALLEEVAMCPVPRTCEMAMRGFEYLLSVRNDGKAWRYWPKDNDNDVSVTTWCVMAVKAAKVAGCEIPTAVWEGVRDFLDEVTEPDSGEVGYRCRPSEKNPRQPQWKYSMTACGLLCRLYMGMSSDDPLIQNGALILLDNLPEWNQPGIGSQFYLYWFYGTLVFFQIGGESWKKWGSDTSNMLTTHQNMTQGNLRGSWDPAPSVFYSTMGGRVYSTAVAVLTLEIHCRYKIMAKASPGK